MPSKEDYNKRIKLLVILVLFLILNIISLFIYSAISESNKGFEDKTKILKNIESNNFLEESNLINSDNLASSSFAKVLNVPSSSGSSSHSSSSSSSKGNSCIGNCGIGSPDEECKDFGFDFGVAKWECGGSCCEENNWILDEENYPGTSVTGCCNNATWNIGSSEADGIIVKLGNIEYGGYYYSINGTNGIVSLPKDISHITFCGYNETQEPYCGDEIINGNEECEFDSDCEDSVCEDKCIENDYYEYEITENDCDECSCENNECKIKNIEYNDARCLTTQCGDGNLDFGEECDDGNLINGDGCDSNCKSEDEVCEHDVGIRYSYGNSFGTGIAIKPEGEDWIEGPVELAQEQNYIIKYIINNKIKNTTNNIHVIVKINETVLADYNTPINIQHTSDEIYLNTLGLIGSYNLSVYVEKINEIDCNLSDNYAEREIIISGECIDNNDCDDGLHCNGEEVCVDYACQQGTSVVCDDKNSCTEDYCDEDLNECVNKEIIDCCTCDGDCPSDFYSDKYCYNNDVYNDMTDNFCYNGKCMFNISNIFVEDCGEDFIGEWVYYCDLDDAHRQRQEIKRGCESAACSENISWKDEFVEHCAYGCVDGICEEGPKCGDGNLDSGEECDDGNLINGDGCDSNCKSEKECAEDSKCQADYYDKDYCYDDDVYHDLNDFYCSLTRTCEKNIIPELKQNCGEDFIGEWVYYCDLDDAHRQRQEIKRGCESAACSENISWKDEFVEHCAYGCENEKCKEPDPYCGDEIINGNEECEFDYQCNKYCILDFCFGIAKNKCVNCKCEEEQKPYCGDGTINQIWEQCDDGNSINKDGCDEYRMKETCPSINYNCLCDDWGCDNFQFCTQLYPGNDCYSAKFI